MSTTRHVFSAELYKVGLIRFVDVPAKISKSLGSGKSRIPVKGSVNGLPLQTTMTPSGNGRHRLAVHGDIYRKLRLDAGATIDVTLSLDRASREPALPPALVVALKYSPVATRHFRVLTTALRRQIVRYLTSAKSRDVVERRIAKFVSRLERGPHPAQKKPASPKPGKPRPSFEPLE
jgi:Domain of unknown function (DUF1905)/Bacteriocin-protection, YdeI or OmpD-Associated